MFDQHYERLWGLLAALAMIAVLIFAVVNAVKPSLWLRAFDGWANTPIARYRGHEFVRLDILLAIGLIVNFATGYYYGQWLGALQASGVYLLVAMTALWVL